MEELNSNNVLDFWKNATMEQQRDNIDKVLDIINNSQIYDMWRFTKKELKIQNPELIVRIIKEKLNNGTTYVSGLWRNTPPEVQAQKIEEVLAIYNKGLMLSKILRETHESIEEIKKEALAKTLNYDADLLKEYEIPEYIPALSGMFGKQDIDGLISELRNKSFIEAMQSDYIEDENFKGMTFRLKYNFDDEEILKTTKIGMRYIMSKIPSTSIPYFFKQLLEDIPEVYVTLFWENIDNNIKNEVVVEVIEQIFSKRELANSIWNEFSPELQKSKIIALLDKGKGAKARNLIIITGQQTIREIIEEIIVSKNKKIISFWDVLPEDIQLEYFERFMNLYDDYQDIDDYENRAYIWQEAKEVVQQKKIIEYMKSISGGIDEIIEALEDTKFPQTDIIRYLIQEYSENRIAKILEKYYIDLPSLELLKGKVSPSTKINLTIKNASELSVEQLNELLKSFSIMTIKMEDENLKDYQQQPYNIETYKECRHVIEELMEGIDYESESNETDREKILFGKIIKRLANHMSYDYVTSKKLDDGTATEEEKINCANMIGGLLNNTCVCSGYAEIVRNVFPCYGIETRYISGNNINPNEAGHAWNQIKLDGIWYNMDLTWSRDAIIAENFTTYLLRSDKDFYGHDEFDTSGCKKEKCDQTVLWDDMERFLYQKLKMPPVLNTSIRKCVRTKQISDAKDRIIASYNREGEKEDVQMQ